MEKINAVAWRKRLFNTRYKLNERGIHKHVKFMIGMGCWKKTEQDNNYLSGRIVNMDFIEALEKMEDSL